MVPIHGARVVRSWRIRGVRPFGEAAETIHLHLPSIAHPLRPLDGRRTLERGVTGSRQPKRGRVGEVRIVKSARLGRGWSITPSEAAEHGTVESTKQAALDEARSQLHAAGGGTLRVYLKNGELEFERTVAADGSNVSTLSTGHSEFKPLVDIYNQVKNEGKHVDKGLDALDGVLGFAAFIGIPAVNAAISPEVQEALDSGWIAVFLATLTWSLGCALATVTLRRSGLLGYPLLFGVSACFVGALLIAGYVGTGVLELQPVEGGGPFNTLVSFVLSALVAYGPLGALVGGGIGAWLGYRTSSLFPEKFLVS